MECVWRRRMPGLVRSLLLDEELSGASEPERMSKDSVSPPLTPAADDEHPSSSVRPCGLCLSEAARYTCPRCNAPYCSLSCYRGSAHAACSELFYKQCVTEELRRRGGAEQQDRTRMRDVLLRMRQMDGGIDRVMRDLVETSRGVTETDTETLILLSRLAEIQADREDGWEDEVQDILQRLGQTDGDEEEEDVVTRLSELNIESVDEDELWKLLPEKDRQMFEQLLKDGGIGALVPIWRPWWEEHERDGALLIEELRQEESRELDPELEPSLQLKQEVQEQKEKKEKSRNAPPPISCEIPPLSALCSLSPSPMVQFSLVNVLYAYVYTLRLFNGDVSETQQLLESTRTLLSVSECLGRGRTSASFAEALSTAVSSVSAARIDSDPAPTAVEDLAHILSGSSRDGGYVLSALAQLRSMFSRVRATVPRDHAHFRRACFLAGRKCEFLQAWANENTQVLRALASRAWSEFQRQTAERQVMERDRKQVQERRKKDEATGKVLIEEM